MAAFDLRLSSAMKTSPSRLLARLLIVAALAVPTAAAALVSWDTAGLFLLALVWAVVARADATLTRQLAGDEDPGRTLVFVIVLIEC